MGDSDMKLRIYSSASIDEETFKLEELETDRNTIFHPSLHFALPYSLHAPPARSFEASKSEKADWLFISNLTDMPYELKNCHWPMSGVSHVNNR
ncbi:MAG: hypothetical protein JSS98_15485 [Bacteroidetes bacterium]|nr:hypothetical protein [Bacteroidota bacterium]